MTTKTKKVPGDYNKTVRYSLEVAERFSRFRKENISKSQTKAAALIGMSQPRISYIERGLNQVTLELVEFLENNYHLNSRWLMHGELPMLSNENGKPNSLLKSTVQSARIDRLSKQLEILAHNLKQAWNIIELQGKKIDRITEEMLKNRR